MRLKWDLWLLIACSDTRIIISCDPYVSSFKIAFSGNTRDKRDRRHAGCHNFAKLGDIIILITSWRRARINPDLHPIILRPVYRKPVSSMRHAIPQDAIRYPSCVDYIPNDSERCDLLISHNLDKQNSALSTYDVASRTFAILGLPSPTIFILLLQSKFSLILLKV